MRRRFSHIERYILAEKTKWKCAICGEDLPDGWHADHIIPISKGGNTEIENGQALCAMCNIKKGDFMEEEVVLVRPLRPWQEEAFAAYRRLRKDNEDKKDFLFEAQPGAGKTRLAIDLMRYELGRNNNKPFFIIVSPNRSLTRQWALDAQQYGFKISEDYGAYKSDTDGWSITYQASVAQASMLHEVVKDKRAIVVFDEIHHLSDKNVWGVQSQYAFGSAKLRIGLTGTPFRSDNRPIAFVTYDPETQYCISDYKLSYSQALSYQGDEKMVRSISFPYFEGYMSWVNENGVIEANFDTDLDDHEDRERLMVALNPNKDYFRKMFYEANDQLNKIRSSGFSHAAGLIFCLDQDHARIVASFVKEYTNEDVVLVISSEEDSVKKLEAFKNSTDKWLVSVRQVTEGVDIPRAIVSVYATNVSTPTHFWQVAFRIGRYINDNSIENSVAYMYLPKHKTFIKYAEEILNEIQNYVDSIKTTPIETERVPSDVLTESNKVFIPLSSDGSLQGHVFDGHHYSAEDLSEALRIRELEPGAAGYDLVVLAKLFSHIKRTNKTTVGSTAIQKPYDDLNMKLREEIKILVESLAGRLSRKYRISIDKFCIGINGFLKNKFGPREKAPLNALIQQKNMLVNKLNDLSWWRANTYVK